MEDNKSDNFKEEKNAIQANDIGYSSVVDSISCGVDSLNINKSIDNTNKQFSTEEIKKIQSDSTSVISDSSEGCYSENLTDSESVKRRLQTRKNSAVSKYDAEYPTIKLNPRSKSHMFKKRYIENVVNEETVEDDYERDNTEYLTKRKQLKFSNINFNDDLPSNFSKKTFKIPSIKSVSMSPSDRSIKGKSYTISIVPVNMDPVVEDKEEEVKTEKKDPLLVLNSPRILFMTDNKEDVTIQTPTYHHSSSSFHYLSKDYSVETAEVIAEDNNENNIENETSIRKKDSLHKIIENMIDKEENYNIQELNVNAVNNVNFEPIKEENIEEEEVIQHKISSHQVTLISDELDEPETIKHTASTSSFRHLFSTDDLIKELDEEDK